MYIDLFIACVLLWALYNGWRQGFLREMVSALGWIVGLIVAATCYSLLGDYLAVDGTETNQITSIAAFLILWVAVPIFLGFVATLITKAVKGKAIGLPNAILGALVSAVKFTILLSCAFNVMTALRILSPDRTENSLLYRPVESVLTLFFSHPDNEPSVPTDNATSDTIWIDMHPSAK